MNTSQFMLTPQPTSLDQTWGALYLLGRQQSKRARASNRQRKFLLVVRLILKSLEQCGNSEDRILAARMKATIREFTRQNRARVDAFVPLQDKLEEALSRLVGDATFMEASFAVDFYLARRRLSGLSKPWMVRLIFILAVGSQPHFAST